MSKYPLKIVVIGGGSGLSVVLRGLKQITSDITAIVTVADDGGSSGDLRADLGMLPPGDIRNCILALSETEPVMQHLMQYRFTEGKLKGHNLGNMLIAGMVGMTGGFEEALTLIHQIFAVSGRVLPVSTDDITLYAKLENGLIVKGESKIPKLVLKHKTAIERVFIEPGQAKGFSESITAIHNADLIMLGPGSLYTSLLPNLLIEDIQEALKQTKAKKVLTMNLMTQPGETEAMSFIDHVDALFKHTGSDFVDYVLLNNAAVADDVKHRYQEEGAKLLSASPEDINRLKAMGIEVIEDALIEVEAGYIRHDAKRLAENLVNLIDTVRYLG